MQKLGAGVIIAQGSFSTSGKSDNDEGFILKLAKGVRTVNDWYERLGVGEVVSSSNWLQNRSFHVMDWTRTAAKRTCVENVHAHCSVHNNNNLAQS